MNHGLRRWILRQLCPRCPMQSCFTTAAQTPSFEDLARAVRDGLRTLERLERGPSR